MKHHIVADKVRESQIMLKKAKELQYKSHNARTKTSMSLETPMPHPHFWFAHPFRPLISLVVVLTRPVLGWLCPKGQVTRAQEAEENYLVKRELATVKQQSEEASAQLEQAKKTIRQLQQQQQPHAVRRVTSWRVAPAQILASLRQEPWHWGWDVSQIQISLCCAELKPQADHFKIMFVC